LALILAGSTIKMSITEKDLPMFERAVKEMRDPANLKALANLLLNEIKDNIPLIVKLRGQLRHGSDSLNPNKDNPGIHTSGTLSTSYDAAEVAKGSINVSRKKTLTVLYEHGPLNDSELAAKSEGHVPSTLRHGRRDCRIYGWVVHHVVDDVRVTRLTDHGGQGAVWELSSKGRQYVIDNMASGDWDLVI
jgi:hypothetical protein